MAGDPCIESKMLPAKRRNTGLRRDCLAVKEALRLPSLLMSDIVHLRLLLALQKDVDYLPMAKPDAINHSRIRRD